MPVVSNNRKFLLLSVIAALLLLSGCSSYKDIRVDSCRIDSILPEGFKSVDAGMTFSVYNPAGEIRLSDIRGSVYFQDGKVGVFEAADVTVPGKDLSDVRTNVRASLSGQNGGIIGIMSMFRNARPEDFTVDVSFTVKVKGGLKKKISLERVPAAAFLGR